ncbi:MAG TPA: hypothetical protein PL110_04835, partial [Candidatus Eremiobacteraeota bacterium]|nr:hypothetical protein [Candidatus Eremiobacteraeota bacterium]
MGIFTGVAIIKLISVYIITAMVIAFTIVVGLWASVRARNSQQAYGTTVGITGFIIISPFILTFISRAIAISIPELGKFAYLSLFLNPLFNLSQILFFERILPKDYLYYFFGNIISLFFYSGIVISLWKSMIKKLSWIPKG